MNQGLALPEVQVLIALPPGKTKRASGVMKKAGGLVQRFVFERAGLKRLVVEEDEDNDHSPEKEDDDVYYERL